MHKKNRKFEIVMMILGLSAFALILYFSFNAVKEMSIGYQAMVNADLSEEFKGSIYYYDHLYGAMGKGIILDETVTDKSAMMTSFLKEALYLLDLRIFSAGIIYAMMISVILLYPLMQKFTQQNSVTLAVCGMVTGIYVFYILSIFIMQKLFLVPFYWPKGSEMLKLISGIIAVTGGTCAVTILLKYIRWKKTTAILIIPVVFIVFIFSMLMEFGLYNAPYLESFQYIAEINERAADENYDGEFYYDEEKNVMVLDGTEYPPEQLENEEHLTGMKRYGAYIFEAVDPYSGNSLYMVEQETENPLNRITYILYALKGFLWVLLLSGCNK